MTAPPPPMTLHGPKHCFAISLLRHAAPSPATRQRPLLIRAAANEWDPEAFATRMVTSGGKGLRNGSTL